jgi:predicted SprT family Zn-dependent metalloprotease
MAKGKRRSRFSSYEQPAGSGPITPAVHAKMQSAVNFLNGKLFDGTLGDAFLTFARRAHSKGHFAPNRYVHRGGDGGKHEINLNPDTFVGASDEFIVSVLAHELCHLWQQEHGTPPSRAYHDRQWSAKMKSIGLWPSSTGAPGGKETGVRMQHYIIAGGRFAQVFAELAATGWKLDLESALRPGDPKGPNSKTKFTCSSCGWNVWGKPDTGVFCKPCWAATGGKLIELRAEGTAAQSYEATQEAA